MQLPRALIAVLVALVSGCQLLPSAPTPAPVRIDVPGTVQVAPTGSTVEYSVTNVSASIVIITMCGPACFTDRYNGALPLQPGETWTGAAPVADLGTLRVLLVVDGVLRASAAISAAPGPA